MCSRATRRASRKCARKMLARIPLHRTGRRELTGKMLENVIEKCSNDAQQMLKQLLQRCSKDGRNVLAHGNRLRVMAGRLPPNSDKVGRLSAKVGRHSTNAGTTWASACKLALNARVWRPAAGNCRQNSPGGRRPEIAAEPFSEDVPSFLPDSNSRNRLVGHICILVRRLP